MKIFQLVSVFALLLILSPLANADKISDHTLKLPIDESSTTKHSTKVNGKKFSYTATTGTQPVWDSEGNPTASLFYTYYKRSGVKDKSTRPLLISFNGHHNHRDLKN